MMRSPFLFAAFVVIAGSLAAACGSGATTTTGTSASASSASSASSTSGAGGSGGAGGMGGSAGSGGYVQPPFVSACDAPMTTVLGTWTAAATRTFGSPRLAWGGSEVSLAYAESTDNGWDVKVQRLLDVGETKGSRFTAGTSVGMKPPHVSLAAGPKSYVVCWDDAMDMGKIACAAFNTNTGASVLGLEQSGSAPEVVYGWGGFVLVSTQGQNLTIARLRDDATAATTPTTIAPAPKSPARAVATTTGFAIAVPGTDLLRLDPHFAMVSTTHLEAAQGDIGLGASGSQVGVAYSDGKQISFVVVDAKGGATSPVKVDAMGAMAPLGHVDVAPGKQSFAIGWSAAEGFLDYRAADYSGKASGTPTQAIQSAFDDDPMTISPVSDGFLIASPVGMKLDTMKVAHLACP